MDAPTEHSDSDSGESWTLLENNVLLADEAPDILEVPVDRQAAENLDEDTDGISIISDSDPESPCKTNYDSYFLDDSTCTIEPLPEYVSLDQQLSEINNSQYDTIRTDDNFLGDSQGKLKTYVHRRNKRLSTVLNIIVLGSVITAAGVAIGHMWGAKNECPVQNTSSSVNKILSNLYKLQEENAYLRSKLKELTLLNNRPMQQQKQTIKQNKCKKMFEETLNSNNINEFTKCVDNHNANADLLEHLAEPGFEKDFVNDLNKVKHVYLQNKSWLDDQIEQKHNPKNQHVSLDKIKNKATLAQENKLNELVHENIMNLSVVDALKSEDTEKEIFRNAPSTKKVSYADSLKSEKREKTSHKGETDKYLDGNTKDYPNNRKVKVSKKDYIKKSDGEDEFKKDDRYIGQKHISEKKKNDRQKGHKKQKRRNKYEQWEMKIGYLKDYDDISLASSQDAIPERNYVTLSIDTSDLYDREKKPLHKSTNVEKPDKRTPKPVIKDNKEKEAIWYEIRATNRAEARKKLENEMFGQTTTNPNTAGWYFRRMQKREQCRARGNNSTNRKFYKRDMNYKRKH